MPERQSRIYVGFQLIVLVALVAYIFFLLDFVRNFPKKKAPFVPSKKEDIVFLLKHPHLQNIQHITDLGCGEGRVARMVCKILPIQRARGYDTNLLLIRRGKLLNRRHKKTHISLEKADFTTIALESDLVYIYLLTSQLEELEPWFKESLPENSMLVSNSFSFPSRTPYERVTNPSTNTTFFIYKKPTRPDKAGIKFPQK